MYTILVAISLTFAILVDLYLTKSRLILRKGLWVSYAIIFPFQLITNGWLTIRNIVQYDHGQILGVRLVGAPVEDLGFGFALILLVLTIWWKQRSE